MAHELNILGKTTLRAENYAVQVSDNETSILGYKNTTLLIFESVQEARTLHPISTDSTYIFSSGKNSGPKLNSGGLPSECACFEAGVNFR